MRIKRTAGFLLRAVLFSLILITLVFYATYVMTPKYDYGICSMVNLYEQPRNSVDVLLVGTSMFYSGVNTNVLWTEYGIPAYNLCSAEQSFWVSYYMIREALKTQNPSVILLDAQSSRYEADYPKPARVILSTYGIRGLENRLGAIFASVEDPMDAVRFSLGLPQVHQNLENVTWQDFAYPVDNGGRGNTWKGYIEMDHVYQQTRPSFAWNSDTVPMNAREEEYARKIFELCSRKGIRLMLVGMPNCDYAADQPFYNALWQLAAEYGIGGINYNEPTLRFGLKYSKDFADWQHLNVRGSMVFTRKLAQDLEEAFGLPDRRGDAAYRSYDDCAEQWYALYPTFVSAEINNP